MRAMTIYVLTIAALALEPMPTRAVDVQYVMRVDGLACPYCAYGIEKKLKRIDGVYGDSVEVDLDAGIVRVEVREGTELTEGRMRALIRDAGFSLRGMEVRPAPQSRGSESTEP